MTRRQVLGWLALLPVVGDVIEGLRLEAPVTFMPPPLPLMLGGIPVVARPDVPAGLAYLLNLGALDVSRPDKTVRLENIG